jgi:hypothetical protein
MAGDWLKVEKDTPDKPEILSLASLLGISPDDAFGKCFRFWRWADSHTTDGTFRGLTPGMIDAQFSCKNFADALSKVGWLRIRNGRVQIPDFEKHMGESAKQRALTAKRVANHKRKNGNASSVSGALPTEQNRRARGEPIVTKSNRQTETIGSSPADQLPKDVSDDGGTEPPFDLSTLDWGHVTAMAENLAKRIPPTDDGCRRMWLKYAVLAEMTFSEDWLMDSVEAVLNAPESRHGRHAHFVGVLRAKARQQNVDGRTLKTLCKRIEIPDDVWDSSILEVAGK